MPCARMSASVELTSAGAAPTHSVVLHPSHMVTSSPVIIYTKVVRAALPASLALVVHSYDPLLHE